MKSTGFSLLELVMALALSAALGMALVLGGGKLFDSVGDRAERLRLELEADRILDQVESDLESFVWRSDGGVWFAVSFDQGYGWSERWEGTGKPDSPESLDPWSERFTFGDLRRGDPEWARHGAAGTWLRFFARPSDRSQATSGAVAAVGYQVIRRRPPGAGGADPPVYTLFRSVVRPDRCWETGYDLPVAPSASPYWSGRADPGAPGDLRRPHARQSLFAFDVVDFGAVLFDFADQRLFPDDAPGELPWVFTAGSIVPVAVEVRVRLLKREGSRRLIELEAGNPGAAEWWDFVERHSQLFFRRIYLKAR